MTSREVFSRHNRADRAHNDCDTWIRPEKDPTRKNILAWMEKGGQPLLAEERLAFANIAVRRSDFVNDVTSGRLTTHQSRPQSKTSLATQTGLHGGGIRRKVEISKLSGKIRS